jgi:ferredoxin-thioredoxin reductase catalytic chain
MIVAESNDKNLEVMRKFSEQYAKGTGTYFCSEKSVTAVVIKGLAEHKDELGAPLCPCRHYDDKQKEAQMGYWNCPCVPMRERKVCACAMCDAMHVTACDDSMSAKAHTACSLAAVLHTHCMQCSPQSAKRCTELATNTVTRACRSVIVCCF